MEGASLSISEGALRAVIRDVGDGMEGLVVERCRLEGDVETPGAPVEIIVEISTFTGLDLGRTSEEFRRVVAAAVARHVDLNITGVSVRVRDTDLSEEEGRAK